MKKFFGVAIVVVLVLSLSSITMARMGGPGMGGWGPGGGSGCGMGWSAGGPGGGPRGMMWQGGGPGWRQGAGPASAGAIDEAKAKEIATDYVTKSLPGYKVAKVVPFQMPRGTMYQVEVKGPKDETSYLHINPWGYVRAFPGRAF